MLIALTLAQLDIADYLPHDVHDMHGTVLAVRGDAMTGELKDRLAKVGPLFKPSQPKHVRHEGVLYAVPNSLPDEGASPSVLGSASVPPDVPELVQPDNAKKAMGALALFWQRLEQGKPADIALLEVARDRLIADLNDRLDGLRYINQLRVRDGFTYDHTLDVASMSVALAIKLGYDTHHVKEIGLAALLHDLGKLLIPRQIMFKAGRLTEAEFQVMKLHPQLGYQILAKDMRLPDAICRPALEHQEMYGGGGYPYNLRGDEIHPYSHIVKIADVYDALTSRRPYKEPIASQKALDIMLAEGARGFHPQQLQTFAELANYQPVAPVVAVADPAGPQKQAANG
jgi:HD-GYP domain-containing protein (c-di-GMP phosphodiesterase class II)